MKKLFALVLAVAMVLSLGSAFAASWGNNNANTATAKAVTVEVTKYVVLNDAAGNPYYSRLDNAAIVKAGDDVAFQVKISVPSANSLNSQFNTDLFGVGDILKVKVEGINLTYGTDIDYGALQIALTDSAQTFYLTKGVQGTAALYNSSQSKDMYLDKAKEYGAVDLKVSVKFISDLSEITVKDANGNKYTVSKDGTTYNVIANNMTGSWVAFQTNEKGKVTNIVVGIDNGQALMAVKKIDGIYQCEKGTATDAQKLAGDVLLNQVCAALGFSAANALGDGIIYMDDQNWAQNFGVYFVNSNNATYQPYPDVPVVMPPSKPDIPKTGSNASVIVFALVAMAIVAAAAVAVKKVRA